MSDEELECPVCGNGAFKAYRGRALARCTACGSKERNRLMGLVLKRLPLSALGKPVYHIAPERGIADLLIDKYKAKYVPADYDPPTYSWSRVPVQKIDLSRVLEFVPSGSAGGFIHSHVLEHIPGSIERVILDMNSAIAPGGFHIFQAPIEDGWYREDMNPDLPEEERLRVFKQEDHLRMFGAKDFEERVLRLFTGFKRIDLTKKIDVDDLRRAAVPLGALSRFTGHSVFLFVKERDRSRATARS